MDTMTHFGNETVNYGKLSRSITCKWKNVFPVEHMSVNGFIELLCAMSGSIVKWIRKPKQIKYHYYLLHIIVASFPWAYFSKVRF